MRLIDWLEIRRGNGCVGLTFVVCNLSFDHSFALPLFLPGIALNFFFLSYVPPVDVLISIRDASVYENKHEREQYQRKVGLWRRHQHIKGAKVIGECEFIGDEPVAEHIKERASNNEKQLPSADLERGNQHFHIGNDN